MSDTIRMYRGVTPESRAVILQVTLDNKRVFYSSWPITERQRQYLDVTGTEDNEMTRFADSLSAHWGSEINAVEIYDFFPSLAAAHDELAILLGMR